MGLDPLVFDFWSLNLKPEACNLERRPTYFFTARSIRPNSACRF